MSFEPEPAQGESQKRYGMTMIVLAWMIVIGFLTLYFGGWLDQQANPNRRLDSSVAPDGVEEIHLRRNRAGHYVATGRINDTEVDFLLDTGATDVSVPEALVNELGLRRGRVLRVQTANGSIAIFATRLDRVSLGSITLYNVRAGINPHMDGREVLLGMSFLGQLDFRQQGRTLTLRRRPSPP